MRPIDADRLLKTIANLDVECVDQKQASIMLNTIQKVFPQIVNDEPTIEAEPCTFCAYNPPSSGDGKPCTVCPAVAKGE